MKDESDYQIFLAQSLFDALPQIHLKNKRKSLESKRSKGISYRRRWGTGWTGGNVSVYSYKIVSVSLAIRNFCCYASPHPIHPRFTTILQALYRNFLQIFSIYCIPLRRSSPSLPCIVQYSGTIPLLLVVHIAIYSVLFTCYHMAWAYLTFRWPCIVIYSYNKINKCTNISNLFLE